MAKFQLYNLSPESQTDEGKAEIEKTLGKYGYSTFTSLAREQYKFKIIEDGSGLILFETPEKCARLTEHDKKVLERGGEDLYQVMKFRKLGPGQTFELIADPPKVKETIQ